MSKLMFKKIMLSLLLTAVIVSMFPARAFADTAISENLLKNPGFEEYVENSKVLEKSVVKVPADWVDPLESWVLTDGKGSEYDNELAGYGSTNTWLAPVDGRYFICLIGNVSKYKANSEQYKTDFGRAEIYQDVDIRSYNTGTLFKLSGNISGVSRLRSDLNPFDFKYDRGIICLNYLDASGKVLASKSIARRGAYFKNVEIKLPKPEGAVTARVVLKAMRTGGYSRNEVYFDSIDFRAVEGAYREVVISGKTDVKAGDTVQLSVDNGISKNPSDFTWWSEMEYWATVDDNGKVSLSEDFKPEVSDKGDYFAGGIDLIDRVTIYAKDSDGNVGSIVLGDTKKYPDDIYYTNTGGTQTPNTNNEQKTKTISGVKVKIKGNKARLTWKKYKGADFYLLYRYDKSKKKWKIVGRLMNKQRTCEVKGLKKNKEYQYRVTAEKRTKTGSKTIATSKIIKVKIK